MQSEMADAADRVFRQLTDADLKFGMVKNEKGEQVELSHSSFSSFLHSPEPQRPRKQRSTSTTSSSQATRTRWPPRWPARCRRDVYYAKARNYPSAREGVAVPRQRAGQPCTTT